MLFLLNNKNYHLSLRLLNTDGESEQTDQLCGGGPTLPAHWQSCHVWPRKWTLVPEIRTVFKEGKGAIRLHST